MDKRVTVQRLIEESRTDRDYYLLLIISTMISTIGLLLGNASVIIGGMLISPLLTPLLSLGLSIITNNREPLIRNMSAIGKSVGLVLLVSFTTSFVMGTNNLGNSEIASRAQPSLLYVYIAILSGIGATYAWIKPKISASLPGIAVAIALVPPLCVVGIGMAQLDRTLTTGALQMFLVNVIGVVGAATVLFSLFGFYTVRGEEEQMIEKEEMEAELAAIKQKAAMTQQQLAAEKAKQAALQTASQKPGQLN
ncbi:MAG: DUF389 domain-containing protein [Chloroflexi bacterium]|nr:DUF389 domain-containing protein [Chloroflexota bacterium]